MVSGTMAINRTTLMAGRASIEAQRGLAVWGANYVYASGGLQEDILLISEELANLSTSGAFATDAELAAVSGTLTTEIDTDVASASGAITTSGTLNYPSITNLNANVTLSSSGTIGIGSAAAPLSSGIFIEAADTSVPMRLVVYANGLVSGVAQ